MFDSAYAVAGETITLQAFSRNAVRIVAHLTALSDVVRGRIVIIVNP